MTPFSLLLVLPLPLSLLFALVDVRLPFCSRLDSDSAMGRSGEGSGEKEEDDPFARRPDGDGPETGSSGRPASRRCLRC